jgi:Spy/CpxP family protein refolding chaperone
MNPQGRTTLKVWLVLVVVFLLGAITGGAFIGGALTGFNRALSHNDRNAPRDRMEKMRRDLSLTDEQMKSVGAILDDTKNEYKALRQELKPRFDEPRQKARAKIRALLTPQQQQKFDAMVAERDAQRDGDQKKQR